MKKEFLFILSIICYLTSLSQIGFNDEYGISLLLFGWDFSSLFSNPANFVWVANPILVYSYYKRTNPEKAVKSSLLTFLIAFSFLLNHSINMPVFCETCPGSIPTTIENIGLGYYLWLSSILLYIIYNYLQISIYRQR